ncbi:PREDICTED: slowmo [Prunus dulcis]|uniref:PREDICTED: slowmo n=1 Tax=Prunus dulcis TaxID=3755 RepID=A0A5E4ETD2_PRUDU|nr:PREDICTED: slowmo [Prunus dulcis]
MVGTIGPQANLIAPIGYGLHLGFLGFINSLLSIRGDKQSDGESTHDVCHCVESTVVDAKTRSMQLTTNNISLEKFIEVEEKIRYDPHPENPDGWTICRQETSIRIKPLSALASMAEKVEQRCAERFVQNSAKGREVMERICKYLEAESKGLARS